MFSEKPEVQLAVIRLHTWKPALPWEMEQYPHRRILPAASQCLSLWPQATTALIWSIFFPIYLKCALSILKLCSSKGNSRALFCGSIRYKMKIIFYFKIDSLWFFRHFGSLMSVLSMEMFCASYLLEARSVCGVQLQRTLPLTSLVVSTHPVRFWGTCAEGHQAMGDFCW